MTSDTDDVHLLVIEVTPELLADLSSRAQRRSLTVTEWIERAINAARIMDDSNWGQG